MTRSRLLLLGVGFMGLLGFAGYEHHHATQLRVERAAANEELRRLRAEAEALRREHAATAAELAIAEQQLAAAAPSHAQGNAATYPAEITSWLDRVKKLRRLFDEKQEQRIPEMNLLTDDDWLRVGQAVKFDTAADTRRALAAVRDAAGQRFTNQLGEALRRFAKAFPNEKPGSVQALVPFFQPPPDPAALARYELRDPSGSPGYGPPTWFVQNKTPVDIVYDSRFRISHNSSFQDGGPRAWIPNFTELYQAAAKAYTTANAGRRPERTTDALPFFNPPLSADLVSALLESEGKR